MPASPHPVALATFLAQSAQKPPAGAWTIPPMGFKPPLLMGRQGAPRDTFRHSSDSTLVLKHKTRFP